jgi:hypothetical protein
VRQTAWFEGHFLAVSPMPVLRPDTGVANADPEGLGLWRSSPLPASSGTATMRSLLLHTNSGKLRTIPEEIQRRKQTSRRSMRRNVPPTMTTQHPKERLRRTEGRGTTVWNSPHADRSDRPDRADTARTSNDSRKQQPIADERLARMLRWEPPAPRQTTRHRHAGRKHVNTPSCHAHTHRQAHRPPTTPKRGLRPSQRTGTM